MNVPCKLILIAFKINPFAFTVEGTCMNLPLTS